MFFKGLKKQLQEEKSKVKNRDKLILNMQRQIDELKEKCSNLEDELEEEQEENKKYHQAIISTENLLKKTKYGTYNDLLKFKNRIKEELSALDSDNSTL